MIAPYLQVYLVGDVSKQEDQSGARGSTYSLEIEEEAGVSLIINILYE